MPTICVDFLSFNIIGIGYDIEICMFYGDTNHGREICMFCGDTNHGRGKIDAKVAVKASEEAH